MNREQTRQLRKAFDGTTKGMWVSVEQGPDTHGLFCNEHVVAEGMSSNDADLVDIMHAHFKELLDEIDTLNDLTLRLKENEENHKLQIESLKRQTAHWHNLYNAAKKAGEQIILETK